MYVLPASGLSDAPSRYTTKPAIEAELAQLEKSWWEYISESDIVIELDVVTEDIRLIVIVWYYTAQNIKLLIFLCQLKIYVACTWNPTLSPNGYFSEKLYQL